MSAGRSALGAAAALLLLASGPVAFASSDGELAPYQMVRSLQMVQDRLAGGDHAAMPMQRKLLAMIDERFRNSTRAEFDDRRNFRSLLIYAMSGGNPATLDRTLAKLELDADEKRLASGVLNYVNGRPKVAKIALGPVEAMKVDVELGPFIALVKGSIAAVDDPPTAARALDQAILLGPGTLVEEAALRRKVSVATDIRDQARFLSASDQYVRRFLRSPYASQFADSFVAGVVAMHNEMDLERVASIIEGMDREQQAVIYLRLARRAAIEGLPGLSDFTRGRSDHGLGPVASDDPRGALYDALTTLTSGTREDIVPRLNAVDRSRLSANDRMLLDAALAVGSKLTGEVPSLPAPAAPGLRASLPATETPDDPAGPTVVTYEDPEGPVSIDEEATAREESGEAERGAVAEATAEPDTSGAGPDAGQLPGRDGDPTDVLAGTAATGAQKAAAPATGDDATEPFAEKLGQARARLEEIDKLLGVPEL